MSENTSKKTKQPYIGLGPVDVGTYDITYDGGAVVRIAAETERQVELLQSHWEHNSHVVSIERVNTLN